MSTMIMMVGLPGSGKSTIIKTVIPKFFPEIDFQVLSTDDLIEDYARSCAKTYNDVFKDAFNIASKTMSEQLKVAITNGRPIIWDQTNLTVKSRARKLAQVPKSYKKIAVWVMPPNDDEHNRRLVRPGKSIAPFIIQSMKKTFEFPTIEEGFDEVITFAND